MKLHYFFKMMLSTVLLLTGIQQSYSQVDTVTNPVDNLPGSLRLVIGAANPGDTIIFGLATNAVPQVLLSGEISIDKALVIIGNDTSQTIISGLNSRIFNINNADSVEISGVSFTAGTTTENGGAILTDSSSLRLISTAFSGNSADTSGGAIAVSAGTLSVLNSSFAGNTASGNAANQGGGAIVNLGSEVNIDSTQFGGNIADGASGSGGAILNLNGGNLAVSNSSFSINTSNRAGGAIEGNSGASSLITIESSAFTANTTGSAPGNGGAIHITGPVDITVNESTFEQNIAAAEGGALWNGSGSMIVSASTLIGNIANGDEADQGGGAIYNLSGNLTVNGSSLIANNEALGVAGSGGGILNDAGASLSVNSSIIRSNTASRAGGGVEDNSGASTTITFMDVTLDSNSTAAMPGNGGGLHITGPGNAEFYDSRVNANSAAREGGGLWNGSGTMIVDNTIVNNNTAFGDESHDGGAGIFNNGGTLTVQNGSVVELNIASGLSASGGGILSLDGAVTIENSSISQNAANRAGGAIELIDGSLDITNSNLDNNDLNGVAGVANPGNGGALHISGTADINIQGGTANGNFAAREGGALWNQAGSTMTIGGGLLIEGNQTFGPSADDGGAGVFNNGGTLILNDAIINANIANGTSASGGGVLNVSGGTISGNGVIITNNSASRAGGGIEDASNASIALNNAIIDSNSVGNAPGNGGGLHVSGSANVSLTGGSVSANTAASEGGGLWNGSGVMTVDGVTINGNTASGVAADQGGGGIYNLSGQLLVTNGTTITNNVADGAAGSGGGILNDVGGQLQINNATISENSAVRAGGALEDVSGASTTVSLEEVTMSDNVASSSPGNGGAVHITGSGNINITNSVVTDNFASAEGGGLWNGSGEMQIDNVVFSNNIASGIGADQGGGAIYNLSGIVTVVNGSSFTNNFANGTAGSGGAILNDVGGVLAIDDASFEGNTSNRAGGAIEDNSGSGSLVSIGNSIFVNNQTGTAPGNGGAIHITGSGDMIISNSSFTGNVASREGGALWNGSGTMTLNLISVEGNTASGDANDDGGAGIFNNGGIIEMTNSTVANNLADGDAARGGGILSVASGTMTIINSTISGNEAVEGAGVSATDAITVSYSTITANTASGNGGGWYQASGTSSFSGTIIASNTASSGQDVFTDVGVTSSFGYNLIGNDDADKFTESSSDLEGTTGSEIDAKLDVLADNGGSTKTHALLCGSPAIDGGAPTNNTLDQLGNSVFGGVKDIGAFELQIDCAVSVNEIETKDSFKIYPNPSTNGWVSLEVEQDLYSKVTIVENASGKSVLSQATSNFSRIDISSLSPGLYTVKLEGANTAASSLLMVTK